MKWRWLYLLTAIISAGCVVQNIYYCIQEAVYGPGMRGSSLFGVAVWAVVCLIWLWRFFHPGKNNESSKQN